MSKATDKVDPFAVVSVEVPRYVPFKLRGRVFMIDLTRVAPNGLVVLLGKSARFVTDKFGAKELADEACYEGANTTIAALYSGDLTGIRRGMPLDFKLAREKLAGYLGIVEKVGKVIPDWQTFEIRAEAHKTGAAEKIKVWAVKEATRRAEADVEIDL